MTIRFSTGLRGEIAGSNGFKGAMDTGGSIAIYSGTQPADADSAETGTLLCTCTVSSLAVGAGGDLTWTVDEASPPVVSVGKGAAVWSGVNAATGTAGWFRARGVATTGASTTAERFDGSVGTSGADLNLGSVSLVSGRTTTVDSCDVTFPANA